MKIAILGKPGAGKGTQGKMLAEHLGIEHISIGDMVRYMMKTDHPLRNTLQDYFATSTTWRPLSDSLTTQIVQKYLTDREDFIVDGFPRNIEQVAMTDIIFDHVFYFSITDEESIKRTLSRQREGDELQKVLARLEIEQGRLPQLISYYTQQGVLSEIDAMQSVDDVYEELKIFFHIKK